MEFLVAFVGLISVVVFLVLLFTRERNNKMKYFTNTCLIFVVCQLCTAMSMPLYGNLFGLTSIALSSVVLATLMDFKGR